MDSPAARPPSLEAMRAVISRALPGVSIESIQPLPSTRPPRDARVRVNGGRDLVLTIPPAPMIRLLRSEQWLVLSEALLISWICKRSSSFSSPSSPHIAATTRDKRISIRYLTDIEPPLTSDHTITTESQQIDHLGLFYQSSETPLIRYLPELIANSPLSPELGVAFNLTEPSRGSVVTLLSPPLSEEERVILDYQKGQFIRHISSMKAPNSKFGSAVAVIGQQESVSTTTSSSGGLGRGIDTWSKAFHAMVEGILRDGEDLAVTISYSQIRHHVQRLGYLLDAVTQSRLVVLDAGSDTNVIVYRGTTLLEQQQQRQPRTDNDAAETWIAATNTTPSETSSPPAADNFSPRNRHWQTLVGDTSNIMNANQGLPNEPKDAGGGNMDGPSGQGTSSVRLSVNGLRDWSICIFGDPLMTEIFNQDPSSDFIRGFRQQQPSSSSSSAAGHISRISSPPPPDDLIEDRENANIRLMLYECYHATVSIVKQFYRPSGPESTRREMEARRRLAAVLNKLAAVEDNPSKRPRTGSLDNNNSSIWPAKKSKSDVGS
ncbi:hypothetical protein G7054_g1401 [Neopestalotiopsis clavispora]|nr:hypothetical protein G7054_g1401 [Neopestalotiopsis clavispora]